MSNLSIEATEKEIREKITLQQGVDVYKAMLELHKAKGRSAKDINDFLRGFLLPNEAGRWTAWVQLALHQIVILKGETKNLGTEIYKATGDIEFPGAFDVFTDSTNAQKFLDEILERD